MNVRDFEYIMELSKAKSISKASQALYISQPALSKFLQKMEAEIGTPLFQHVGRQLIPTYAGEQCIQTASEILFLHEQLLSSLADIAHEKNGHIKLGLPLSRSEYFIAEILPAFYQRFPDICISVYEDSAKILLKMLRMGELNLVFCSTQDEHKELIYEMVSQEEMVLAAPEAFGLREFGVYREGYRYPCLSPEHWKDYPFLMLSEDQMSRAFADRYLEKHRLEPKTVLKIRNLGRILFSVQQGLGVTLCPSLPILEEDGNRRVCYFSLESEDGPAVRSTSIAYRRDAYLSVAEKALIELIKEHFDRK